MKYYAPTHVYHRYQQLLVGYTRTHGNATITTKEHSKDDEEVMERLIYCPEMEEVWQSIIDEKEQLTFFTCAWVANIDYKKIRKKPPSHSQSNKEILKSSGNKNTGKVERVLNEAKKLGELSLLVIKIFSGESKKNKRKVNQALKSVKKLQGLINEINSLGNTPARYPDKCLDSYHLQNELAAFIEKAESFNDGSLNSDTYLDSNNLQEELAWLIEKAEKFDYDNLNPYEFVNSAIFTKLYTPDRDYLRGFIKCLYDSGFCFVKPNICKHLSTTASVVLSTSTIYDDAHRAMKQMNVTYS